MAKSCAGSREQRPQGRARGCPGPAAPRPAGLLGLSAPRSSGLCGLPSSLPLPDSLDHPLLTSFHQGAPPVPGICHLGPSLPTSVFAYSPHTVPRGMTHHNTLSTQSRMYASKMWVPSPGRHCALPQSSHSAERDHSLAKTWVKGRGSGREASGGEGGRRQSRAGAGTWPGPCGGEWGAEGAVGYRSQSLRA